MGSAPSVDGSVHDYKVEDVKGAEYDLAQHKGKVMLIVNTASECGFTKQYKGLEELYKEYKEKGVEVIGFPCNQFGGQEPGSEEEIVEFCQKNFGVTFPLMKKIDVNGDNEAPLYTFLKSAQPGTFTDKIKWNFTKFLVDPEGKPIERYSSLTKPEDIKKDIDNLLPSVSAAGAGGDAAAEAVAGTEENKEEAAKEEGDKDEEKPKEETAGAAEEKDDTQGDDGSKAEGDESAKDEEPKEAEPKEAEAEAEEAEKEADAGDDGGDDEDDK